MKKFILTFCITLAFVFSAEACPYQKMAEVDSKLFSNQTQINKETFVKISDLRVEGEEQLKIGELDNAEEIFDRALALFSK
mgnify:FL=1